MATTRHVESKFDNSGKVRKVEVFEFHNPGKRKKEDTKATIPAKQARRGGRQSQAPVLKGKSQKQAMSLEEVRRDVRNLGVSGLSKKSRIEADLSRLKSLGAIIPKNWQRKMDRKKRNEDFARHRQDMKAGVKTKKIATPGSANKDQLKKKKDDGVFFDGQVGTYKRGVQYISAADIKKIRGAASKKK